MKQEHGTYRKLKIFFGCLAGEFRRWTTYINAFLVGSTINLFTLGHPFRALVPFLVPVFVQAFSRASLRYVNRFKERLMELPMERENPVFIMAMNGEIVLAGGKTRETFTTYNIKNIGEFIGQSGLDAILGSIAAGKTDPVEVFSEKTKKWYEVKFKQKNIDDISNILVWFDVITERKILDPRIYSMLNFSDDVLSNLYIQKVIGLCAAAEYSDEITGKHIYRMNEYARLMATYLGCPPDFIRILAQVAALHDIGNMAIPQFIKLQRIYTAEEMAKMRIHTIYGAKIIKTMMKHSTYRDERLQTAYNIALNHHQWWNGKGYPGLKKNGAPVEPISEDYTFYEQLEPLREQEIPLEARIVGLADAYDALRSTRPYKKGLSHADAYAFLAIEKITGTTGDMRFGPDIWQIFTEKHGEFDEIFKRLPE